ncbi:uncharacterized protein LOC114459161 [Gouania willdenowi]|uniref:uncharacterized protein LOC114459161 n=1 Tax=Gouania willdenowi TaxID=441366 RepID=UPI00105682E4|nr:uncharacterized protein LOC114459161 [Gouania willdenowi]
MGCQVTPCAGSCLVPMGPPGRGVIPAPSASQGQWWLSEVQHRTSFHIYEAASHHQTLRHSAAAIMEMCFGSTLKLQENKALHPDPDSGYFSAGSSLSPTSSVDSFCCSPSSLLALANGPEGFSCPLFTSLSTTVQTQRRSTPCSTSSSTTKKSRSKYPSKKRHNASEREKLRMRDLTKALNHLRTYLPPSVAPAGQTLTKIETLRLTIRYISYLSAQLGLSEDVLELRRSTCFNEHTQTLSWFLDQPADSLQESTSSTIHTAQLGFVQPSHKDLLGVVVTTEPHWTPQQQSPQATFPAPY